MKSRLRFASPLWSLQANTVCRASPIQYAHLTDPPCTMLQDLERYKAALARPGRLTAALAWVRAAFRAATKWDLPALDR